MSVMHSSLWASPAPLWGRFGDADGAAPGAAAFGEPDQARPAILRFASDEFMDQLLAMLAADPRQLGHVIARPETWRSPAGETPDLAQRAPVPRLARALARLRSGSAAPTALARTTAEYADTVNGVAVTRTLKLYHPAHQRHYLVAASLVCGVPGFPDRAVATGGREQVGFVLRRLLPRSGAPNPPAASDLEEYAFVKWGTAGVRWTRAAPNEGRPADGEEVLPLFPLNFRDDAQHPRRMLAGMIPVGRREEYMGTRAERGSAAAAAAGAAAGFTAGLTVVSARKEQLKLEVSEPWKNLVRTAYNAAARNSDVTAGAPPDPLAPARAIVATNDQLQGQSWLLLLDFADYLETHVGPVWALVSGGATSSASLPGAGQRLLFDWLNAPWPAGGAAWPMNRGSRPFAATLADALRRVRAAGVRERLEGATRTFPGQVDGVPNWPDFVYLLAGLRGDGQARGVHETLETLGGVEAPLGEDVEARPLSSPARVQAVEAQAAKLDRLVQLVVGAIDKDAPAAPAPEVPFAARLRDALLSTQGDPGWFVLRCVYVRCDCGPLEPAVVSAPSQRFQLASFFDSDAPARPIRIALPLDTTAAGLRKHSKNTAFVISDALCGQMQRLKGLGFGDLVLSVLPWPFHKDLDVGQDGIGACEKGSTSLGMICSLSIPIITICALILLFMIVLVLDLIFKWLPWFIVCFPLPGLKAKKA
ncbi:MAG TPA: hypothetical protein VKA84_23845 [Gemmatimonadaceae bacterium]|nr:hypothetical protein [Gemmatimonadaceae bacterium]